jgi:hypothetical protein
VLNEAVGRDTVIAFVGKPHSLVDRGSQVIKALTEIGFDHYYQAELKGWILYLEGPSDLAILQAFADTLNHKAASVLENVFVHYVASNLPQRARDHFNGLREAKQDLVGVALFDRLDKNLQQGTPLHEMMWKRREIENYLCTERTLLAYARHGLKNDLFGLAEEQKRTQAMKEAIAEVTSALQTLRRISPWSADAKASDDVLDPLFEAYFKKLGLPNVMKKSDYHSLAAFVAREELDPEIVEKLDIIVAVAQKAKPVKG